jgi:spermidine/putrescine-binding protein
MHSIGEEMIRTVLAAGALALLAAGPAAAQTTLTVSGFGIAQDQFRRILYAPFEAQCGCKIAVEAGNSAERLAKMEARRANPEIDIAVLSDADAMIARPGSRVFAAGKGGEVVSLRAGTRSQKPNQVVVWRPFPWRDR